MSRFMQRGLAAAIAPALFLALSATAAGEEFHQHGAHEHGAAELRLVLDGSTVEAELESPAVNLVGFEHPPTDAEERKAVRQAAWQLRDGLHLLGLPAAAGCRQEEAKVSSPLLDEDEKGGHAADHADFDVDYRFTCAHPEALDRLQPALFTLFPATHSLRVAAVLPAGQRAAELTPDRPNLELGDE